jgi:hypothetical protein
VKAWLDRHFAWATVAFVALLAGGFYAIGFLARRRRRGGGEPCSTMLHGEDPPDADSRDASSPGR